MKEYRPREDLRPLLRKARKLFPGLLGHVEVEKLYLCSFEAKASKYVARIHARRKPWDLVIPTDQDYLIEFWATRFDEFSKAYQLYVAVHELMHIPKEGHLKEEKAYRMLVKHTLEDFTFLRGKYGVYLENVDLILKGEEGLYEKDVDGKQRYPRTMKIG